MEIQSGNIEQFIFNEELTAIVKQNNLVKLKQFIQVHPDNEEEIMQAFLLLQNLEVHPIAIANQQIEEDFQKLIDHIKRRKRQRTSLWLSTTVAACLCLVFGISLLFTSPQTGTEEYISHIFSLLDTVTIDIDETYIVSGPTYAKVCNNEIITQTQEGGLIVGKEKEIQSADLQTDFIHLVVPNGRRASIKFQDGTVAWLNSGSKLAYPKRFADYKREIFVEGEIFLEVKNDSNTPFVVHTKKFNVEVLGTSFNVRAYNEDIESSVVLLEGSVNIISGNMQQQLLPNQGYFAENNLGIVREVDTDIYTCWKEGVMKISGEILGDVFARLTRHYNVKIEIDDSQQVFFEKYRGKLNLYDSLEEILTTLSASIPFNFKTIDNNTIHIYVNNLFE